MIDGLSNTLNSILTQAGLPSELSGAYISFARLEEFKPSQTTVNLFLYDIRENLELRSNEPTIERVDGHAITHRSPLRVACSYLITTWPMGVSGEAASLLEQRLLGQVLQVLSRYPTIPKDFLKGSLVDQELPLPMVTAVVDSQKNMSEFWTALGSKLRPSLTVTVTIALPVFADVSYPIVTTKSFSFEVSEEVEETRVQIGGRVLDSGSRAAVAGALVEIGELGLRTTTDSEGRYSFLKVPAGTHTIRVLAFDYQLATRSLVVPGRREDYEVI
jgi:hypothetical protein